MINCMATVLLWKGWFNSKFKIKIWTSYCSDSILSDIYWYIEMQNAAINYTRFPRKKQVYHSRWWRRRSIKRWPERATRSWTTACRAVLVRQHLRIVSISPCRILRVRICNHYAHTVHSCANGITRLVHQDASVVTKTDNSSINALHLLLDAHNHGMSNISATNLVGKSSTGAFGAGGPLLLNDNDYTVPYSRSVCNSLDWRIFFASPFLRLVSQNWGICRRFDGTGEGRLTNCCGALLFQDVDALDDRGAGVVDTV